MRRAARRELSTRLGGELAGSIAARADAAYPAVAARIPTTRGGARHLLRTSAYAVALHRELVAHGMEPGAAGALISDAVFASIRRARDALARMARLRHRDRLRRAMWASSVVRRFYYTEPDWEMHDVAVEGGFGMDVTRCVVAEFFTTLGMSQLCQRAICDQDIRLAAHRGIVLERSGTLAGGAQRCDFRYYVPGAREVRRAPGRKSRRRRARRCRRRHVGPRPVGSDSW